MTTDIDRERRQLALASARLEAYRAREVPLGRLVSDLNALWHEFQLGSADWIDSFRGHWWTLEQVQAVALDRGHAELSEEYQVLVDDAVDQLRFLVDEAQAIWGSGD